MRILITGGKGMLGRTLCRAWKKHEVIAAGRAEGHGTTLEQMRRIVRRQKRFPHQFAAIEFAVRRQEIVVIGKSQPFVRTPQCSVHHRTVRAAYPSDSRHKPFFAPCRTGEKFVQRRTPHTRVDRFEDERPVGRRLDDPYMREGHRLAALRRRDDGIGHPLRRRKLKQQIARAGRILPAAGKQQQHRCDSQNLRPHLFYLYPHGINRFVILRSSARHEPRRTVPLDGSRYGQHSCRRRELRCGRSSESSNA